METWNVISSSSESSHPTSGLFWTVSSPKPVTWTVYVGVDGPLGTPTNSALLVDPIP